MVIAWDIETCPLPEETLSAAQRRRFEMMLAQEMKRHPELDREEASRKVRSLHPFLGWICCIAVVREKNDGQPLTPHSFAAATPAEEGTLLQAFWEAIGKFNRHNITWVSYNGKRFDAEFLRTRTLAWGITPPRHDIFHENPYGFTPHCDLMGLWRNHAMRLEDVCELLGIPSPKQDLNGNGVCEALAAGDLDRVRRYCEADVVATLACYRRLHPFLSSRK